MKKLQLIINQLKNHQKKIIRCVIEVLAVAQLTYCKLLVGVIWIFHDVNSEKKVYLLSQ